MPWDPSQMTEQLAERFQLKASARLQEHFVVYCKQCQTIVADATIDPRGCMEEHMGQCQSTTVSVTDRRGKTSVGEACRVCGSSTCHSQDYNRPTMECVQYLRDKPVTAKQVSSWLHTNLDRVILTDMAPGGPTLALVGVVYMQQDQAVLLKYDSRQKP